MAHWNDGLCYINIGYRSSISLRLTSQPWLTITHTLHITKWITKSTSITTHNVRTTFRCGGSVATGKDVGVCDSAFAVPLTRMSSTITGRPGIVNPNSRLYLQKCIITSLCNSCLQKHITQENTTTDILYHSRSKEMYNVAGDVYLQGACHSC